MSEMRKSNGSALSSEEIQAATSQQLLKYEDLNQMEHFAMFLGVAQVLELNLKSLLNYKYGIDFESMERWTLGQVVQTLKDMGVRGDLCSLLKDIVGYRNYVAHEYLANEFELAPFRKDYPSHGFRKLQKWTIELEQVVFLCEQTEEHGSWG